MKQQIFSLRITILFTCGSQESLKTFFVQKKGDDSLRVMDYYGFFSLNGGSKMIEEAAEQIVGAQCILQTEAE